MQDKRLARLEEMLEMESGSIKPEMKLSELDAWDSMAVLSFIVLLEDEYDKNVGIEPIRALVTVQDAMNLMGEAA